MPDEIPAPVPTVPSPEPVAPKVAPVKSPSVLAAEAAAAKAQAIAKANYEASEVYKKAVGSKFSNGKKTAEVREYVPSRLHKLEKGKGSEPRQCFLVNYGHPNVSFFVACFEFMQEYKPLVEGQEPPVETVHNLPQ